MKTAEIQADLDVLHRLARAWLNGATRVVIDARGLTVTVPTETAARRIAESHSLGRACTTLALTWTGKVGDVPVAVIVETPTPVPTPRPRVVA